MFWHRVVPIKFNSTSPTLPKLLEIKFLDDAAKTSELIRLNYIAPELVILGDIIKPSLSLGSPITSI